MRTRYDLDRDEVAALLDGEPRYRVDQVIDGWYRRLVDPEDATDLPGPLRQRLAEEAPPALTPVTSVRSEGGDTIKELWELGDGQRIETVLMRYPDRTTVCISSQAGCAMGCGFCATGQAGFDRHLSVGEIVEQVVRAMRAARPRRLSNVVFMGMGEPLANTDRVLGALERINTDLGIGARHLTVSTVGVVPGIDRLASQPLQVGLAVSLHAADDDLRSELVPLNRRYPLDELMAACRRWIDAHGRRLSFEWAMIDEINDTDDQADLLARRARRLGAHVNLIPLNPTPGWSVIGSPPARIAAFAERLRQAGVNATIRDNRGTGIDAACGQLRAEAEILLSPPSSRRRDPAGRA